MKRVEISEIKTLYNSYGVNNDDQPVRTVLNRGSLNKRLNNDFSNIYGKEFVNHYGCNTPIPQRRSGGFHANK